MNIPRFPHIPVVLAGLIMLLSTNAKAAEPTRQVVDEPIGARYSLGLTLWHMRHDPAMIRAQIFDEINRIAADGPTEAEMEKLRNSLCNDAVRGRHLCRDLRGFQR